MAAATGRAKGDKVRAVWTDGSYWPTYPNYFSPTASNQVDLTYAGNGRFTGLLPDTVILNSSIDGAEQPYQQRLAIVHNGDWLTDPVTGSHDFKMDLRQASL